MLLAEMMRGQTCGFEHMNDAMSDLNAKHTARVDSNPENGAMHNSSCCLARDNKLELTLKHEKSVIMAPQRFSELTRSSDTDDKQDLKSSNPECNWAQMDSHEAQ